MSSKEEVAEKRDSLPSAPSDNSGPSSLEFTHAKDEYLEDPLPDLVGNLNITEEPEPDLTVFDQEFVLEDFEYQISTSDEEDDRIEGVDDGSGSDLDVFDRSSLAGGGASSRAAGSRGGDGRHSSNDLVDDDRTILPESESAFVDFEEEVPQNSINNCDNVPTTSSGATLANVRLTAKKVAGRVRNIVGKVKGKGTRNGHVRVVYHNLDKPYVARVSPAHQFKNFLTLGDDGNNGEDNPTALGLGRLSQSNSVSSELGSPIDPNMTAEELQAARAEWQSELTQVEDEINTLRQVLSSKMKRAHELKKKLGITAWSELTSDMGQGIKNVRDSTAVQKIEETLGTVTTAVTSAPIYQKTESVIKATAEKTTSIFGGIGSAVGNKIGALRNADSFRSMEERVTGAVSSIKTKMGGSRSGSMQSFDEALREATANQQVTGAQGAPGVNGQPTATAPAAE